MKHLKGFRSAASIGSATPRSIAFETERQILMSSEKSPKPCEDINQIICYYDISDKYGVAYLLSNGNYGIIFNDKTSLTAISDPNSEKGEVKNYIYFDKIAQNIEKFPDELIKKK